MSKLFWEWATQPAVAAPLYPDPREDLKSRSPKFGTLYCKDRKPPFRDLLLDPPGGLGIAHQVLLTP